MSLLSYFKDLKVEIKKSPKKRSEELNSSSGYEAGIKHLGHNTFMLCRDDGAVEMNAGPSSRVIADKDSQSVMIGASNISLSANNIHFFTGEGGLYFGHQRLNPLWLVDSTDNLLPPPAGQRWLWQNAPVVQNYPSALFDAIFLTGTPAPGQVPISLAAFLHPQPLFGPNEELLIYSNNIAKMLSNLSKIIPSI